MKEQYHVHQATDSDELVVQEIFASAAARFGLVDTKLSCLLEGVVCNYSEGLGWGFGLGVLRVGPLICVGLNSCKATEDRFRPVFDYIITRLQRAFGSRVTLASPNEETDVTSIPRIPATDEHRKFFRALMDRDRTKDVK